MTDRYDYLIAGGGMTADAAARGIRELDADGTIGILSADVDAPYTRPALSKKLWTDAGFTWDQVPLNTVEDTGAELRLRTEVVAIDRAARTVTTASGDTVGYERLLLAMGATPSRLDGDADPRVIHFRSAQDYHALRRLAPEGARVVVVGGGFIGSELAAALAQNGVRVTLVHPDEVLGGGAYPAELAREQQSRFVDAGVDLRGGRRVSRVTAGRDLVVATLDDGAQLDADAVVAGLGVSPVTGPAEAAGLAVDDGVVVDERLRTADARIWASGDLASYPDPILGRTRVEHVDQAERMGAAAGRAMAADRLGRAVEPYTHTPSYYSDVFDIGWEAVGTLDASLETVVDRLDADRAVVYYLDAGRVVGVLLWNVFDATDAARAVLADPAVDPATLRGRIAPDPDA